MANPDNLAIICNARVAIRDIVADLTDLGHVETLKAVDVALNELALRENETFYVDQRRSGDVLLDMLQPRSPAPDSVSEEVVANRGYRVLDRLTQRLMEALPANIDNFADNADLLYAISDWENRLYLYRLEETSDDIESLSGRSRFTRETFQQYLSERFPDAAGLKVERFEELPVGFSKKTIMVELDRALFGTTSLVIRAEPNVRLIEIDGADPRFEFPTVMLAYRAGLPVPEPLWVEADVERLGMRFFVSRRGEGANLGTLNSAQSEVPDAVLEDLARHLARLHSVQLDPSDPFLQQSHLSRWLHFPTITESTTHFVRYWRRLVELGELGPSPLLEIGLRWMEHNVPRSSDVPVFLHGDYGLHNVLVDGERVSAILDWETSHIGDPAEDVTHLLTFTAGIDQERFLSAYARHGGAKLTPYRLRYFEVFQCVLMIASCLVALSRLHVSAQVSPKLLVLGVRHMNFFASRLIDRIRDAEAAKAGDG